jgi:hypothetical protein
LDNFDLATWQSKIAKQQKSIGQNGPIVLWSFHFYISKRIYIYETQQ